MTSTVISSSWSKVYVGPGVWPLTVIPMRGIPLGETIWFSIIRVMVLFVRERGVGVCLRDRGKAVMDRMNMFRSKRNIELLNANIVTLDTDMIMNEYMIEFITIKYAQHTLY